MRGCILNSWGIHAQKSGHTEWSRRVVAQSAHREWSHTELQYTFSKKVKYTFSETDNGFLVMYTRYLALHKGSTSYTSQTSVTLYIYLNVPSECRSGHVIYLQL